MAWTPPSKLIVILTLILMVFGIFIFIDVYMTFWDSLLPTIEIFNISLWDLLILILFFLTWFLFFLGVKLKGI